MVRPRQLNAIHLHSPVLFPAIRASKAFEVRHREGACRIRGSTVLREVPKHLNIKATRLFFARQHPKLQILVSVNSKVDNGNHWQHENPVSPLINEWCNFRASQNSFTVGIG